MCNGPDTGAAQKTPPKKSGTPAAILFCHNASFGYENRRVIENLNFEIPEGAYLAIVGENGSGKSTLLKGILGLKAPEGGHVSFDDKISRRDVGYLPQRTDVQKEFPASVMEVVLSGAAAKLGRRPFYSAALKTRAQNALKLAGAEGLGQKSFMELSGGQQQRVLLARALTAADRVLVMDEPVTGLDPAASDAFYKTVEALNCGSGMTVIMVTHDLAPVLKNATHILELGRTVFFGTAEEYRRFRLNEIKE